jgi:hypothetical protein
LRPGVRSSRARAREELQEQLIKVGAWVTPQAGSVACDSYSIRTVSPQRQPPVRCQVGQDGCTPPSVIQQTIAANMSSVRLLSPLMSCCLPTPSHTCRRSCACTTAAEWT